MRKVFEHGKFAVTHDVMTELSDNPAFAEFVRESLERYLSWDWGNTNNTEKCANDRAVLRGNERIVATYTNPYATPDVCLFTEWDHSLTVIMFLWEYENVRA